MTNDPLSVLLSLLIVGQLLAVVRPVRLLGRLVRRIRPQLVAPLGVAAPVALVVAGFAFAAFGQAEVARPVAAQGSEQILLPRGSTWTYYYNNYSVPPLVSGPSPFRVNSCAGDSGGTEWWSGGGYIDMHSSFTVGQAPVGGKVRVRSAGASPGIPFPYGVTVRINGQAIGQTWTQASDECDTFWSAELTVPANLIVAGNVSAHLRMIGRVVRGDAFR